MLVNFKWVAVMLAVCALGVGVGSAQAQGMRPVAPMVMAPENSLTVHGHAEMQVKPDVAYVDVGVVTQSEDSTKAVQDNAKRATALVKAVKDAGIADKDVHSQFYAVQPQYDYNPSPARLTGYQVTNNFRITVRDLTKVGDVIDKATQAGGNQVNNVSFDLGDRTQAESDALAKAVTSAKSKAAVMAQAAGVTLGRLLSLSDMSTPTVQPYVMRPQAMMMKAADAPSTPIESQDISVTTDVTAVYAIGM